MRVFPTAAETRRTPGGGEGLHVEATHGASWVSRCCYCLWWQVMWSRWAFNLKPTLQLRFLPEVIKALEAARVLQCQLVAKVPEEECHEDDEESNGGQKAQHLWRDWDTEAQVTEVYYHFSNKGRTQTGCKRCLFFTQRLLSLLNNLLFSLPPPLPV